jgi:hypothetical protein
MSTVEDEVYAIFTSFHDPLNYTTANGLPILKAICTDRSSAAELVAKAKIGELTTLSDAFRKTGGKVAMENFVQTLFVVKLPKNINVNPLEFPKVAVTERDLSDETRKDLQAAMASYNQLRGGSKISPSSSLSTTNQNLRVDPSIYDMDRRAREYEMMKRLNVEPVRNRTVAPQPAQPIAVQPVAALHMSENARPNSILEASSTSSTTVPQVLNTNVAIPQAFQSPGGVPATSIPARDNTVLPVASQTPTPLNTSVPIAPVVPGSGIMNVQSPQGVASAGTDRITM